jgi:hypothetical protein
MAASAVSIGSVCLPPNRGTTQAVSPSLMLMSYHKWFEPRSGYSFRNASSTVPPAVRLTAGQRHGP